jgi:hypothetical protein
MDFKETGREDMDWIHLARDRDQRQILLNTVMNLRVALRWVREFLD